LRPTLRRLEFLHRTNLVRSVAWHTDVVVAFKDELDVADLESRGVTELGKTTSARDNLINEVICDLKDGLTRMVSGPVEVAKTLRNIDYFSIVDSNAGLCTPDLYERVTLLV